MSNNISSMRSNLSWENIKETALQNDKLNADIRVGDRGIEVNASSMCQRLEVAIGLEKAPVYETREETLRNLRDHFDVYFSKELCQLVKETGIDNNTAEYEQFVKQAMDTSDAITQKLTTTIATPTVSTSQAIQEAHKEALNSFHLLREKFSKPQLTPQFCKTKDGKWSVLQLAPHPENFVLSGGGVKGAGYVGWFKAAEQFGVLKNLKRIAGSSAGAMTAALIASGMNADDLKTASDRTSFWSCLTGSSHDPVINTATKLDRKGWLSCFSFSGTYAVDHLNQEMVSSIKKYFKEFKTKKDLEKEIERIENEKIINAVEKVILENLYKNIAPSPPRWPFLSWFQKKQSTYMVTFQDLAALAKIDSRFKELTVTGFSITQKKEKNFNAAKTPKVPIATAVRGSMAIPVVFDPVEIEGEWIVDGGVGSNTPAEVFKELPQEKTLVLQFENNGYFNQIVYEPKKNQSASGVIAREEEQLEETLTGNPNLEKDFKQDDERLHNAGPNAMMVGEGDLGLMSFLAGPERIHRAQRQAEIRAIESFSLRQNQATDHIFNSLEEAMKAMTDSELEDIALHYASKPNEKEVFFQKERMLISRTAQNEIVARHQMLLPVSV